MYQQVTVIGRVGKDLEMKGSVGKFSVASTRRWNKDGQKQEETTWFNCDLFGKLAESVGGYIKKGGLIHVTGTIRTNEYNGKQYWSVAVDKVTLIQKPQEQQQEQQQQQQQAGQYNHQPAANMDEIPF